MTILLFLFGVAVAAGLFFILADILKLPRLSTEKALLSAGRAEKKRMKSLDALFLGWAIKLSKFIRMDEYKRHRMERTLSAAGMDMTPEVYLAYTILKPAAALLAVIPCLLIFPLLSPIVVLLSILLYFKESRKAEEKVTERREKIDLPGNGVDVAGLWLPVGLEAQEVVRFEHAVRPFKAGLCRGFLIFAAHIQKHAHAGKLF